MEIRVSKNSLNMNNTTGFNSKSDTFFAASSSLNALNNLSKNSSLTNDIFNSNSAKNNVSFGKSLSEIFNIRKTKDESYYTCDSPSSFVTDLTNGINKNTDKKIFAKNLKKIMTPEEFKRTLPELKEQNFIYSKENISDGIYKADLDYQTNFSSGKENIFDILDKAADCSQNYYKKTRKDFLFAVTDRDSLEGLQHAIRIIGENPNKYRHMIFLPAVKLSFAHKAPTSDIGYENSEMLVYGVNPFSDNLVNYVENTIQKRKEMTINFIKDVSTLYPEFAYTIIEFVKQNDLKYKRDYTVSNLYWRAREYATTKGDTAIKGISLVPEEIIKEAADIIDNLSEVYLGSNKKSHSSLGSQIIKDSDVNMTIKKVFGKYSTHYDESSDKVISSAENLYEDMIECFEKEPQKPVMALASPFYFSHYFEKYQSESYDNVVNFFNNLQKDSNGMLCAFESHAPNYIKDENLSPEIIQKFNEQIRKETNLNEVGGTLLNIPIVN